MFLLPVPEYMEGEPVNVNEFQELARQALPKIYYDYYSGGAEDEYTLKQNVEAFQGITIRPRILVDVSRIDLSTTVLGYQISVPILIAPSAKHKWAHPEGEVATARAAALCDTIMILSYRSTCTIEEVASSCNAVRFFQCYVYKRRDISANLLQRAERCGYKAIVLTVDSPRLGRREKDIKNKMVNPQLKNFEGLISTRVSTDDGSKIEAFDANTAFDASLSWKDIGWLRSITNLPVLLKGVLTHEDAIKAVEVGVDGIVVSNHGARQGKGRFYVGIVMELALLVDLGAPWMTDIKATILSHQRRFTIQAFVISSVSWINICFTPVVFLACTSLLYT
ncbi:hypothetical protein PVK06_021061 [Gossypium arboreum]|uniref:(S)-2-hydroxy-acid oxidase n=1 Tax=Gossypium arboreum TaxID=29729 RepID=A0ABR0PPH2_GOSAR|nr:hypothetical protein PVK06_021061 [Gossypium arboreum]